MQVISLIPALLNSGILMVYKIGFTNELAKNSNSQMHLKRNRASSDNMLVICSSKKAKNTYEVHTQRATSVITQSFYSEFSFFSILSAVIMTRLLGLLRIFHSGYNTESKANRSTLRREEPNV